MGRQYEAQVLAGQVDGPVRPRSVRHMNPSDATESHGFSGSSLLNAGLLTTIAAILILDFNGYRRLMPVDEGQWLFYSDQLLSGRVLYKDVWYQFGPAVLYGLVGTMLLAGKTLATERVFFWLLNVAGLASLYVFSTVLNRRVTPRLVLCLVALLNSLTCRLMMVNPGFLFRQCFNLLPLFLLFKAATGNKKSASLTFSAGVLSMLSVLVSQETGLFSFVASSVFLVLRSRESGTTGDWLKPLGCFVGGFLLVAALWSGFCLSQGSLKQYFLVGFGEVFLMAGKHQSAPFPGLSTLFGVKGDLVAYYHFGLTYVPVLTAVVSGAWLLIKKQWNARVIALCSYGICTFTILLGRCDIYHSTFAALPLLLLLSYGYENAHCIRDSRVQTVRVGLIAMFCILIVVSNLSNLTRLASNSRFAAKVSYEETLPYLGSALIPGWQHTVIRFAKSAVEENTDPNQVIFAFLHAPHQYFFLDRPTRTRYATPIFANNESAKKEILDDLQLGDYELLVYEPTRFPNIDYDYYFSEIFHYVKDRYVLHSEIANRVQILKLKESALAPQVPQME